MDKKQTSRNRKRKVKPVYKPYLKGNAFSALAVKRGGKILVYVLIFLVFNLFIGSVFSFDSQFLRILLNGLQTAVYAMVLFFDGMNTGDGDVGFAEIQYAHHQAGETISKEDRDHCFHSAKGFVTVLCGLLPVILICLAFALTTKKNTYTLQVLPSWVAAFSAQEEIAAPLAYYGRNVPFTVLDALRVFVRILLYPVYNMIGARNADAVLLADRLSPALVLVPFLFYGIGYIFGVRSRAMMHGGMALARRHRKKTSGKKPVQKKPDARRSGGKELI